jgi:hypothetical protein
MTEYTEDEIKEIVLKAKQEAANLEQWTIAEDTCRRILRAAVAQQIAAGLIHPFHQNVAETMYSNAIVGRTFTQPQEKKDEAPKSD